jgi:predicted PurR-regulated permease PerM
MKPSSTTKPAADSPVAIAAPPVARLRTDLRGIGIAILATVAAIWMLDWAQPFFVSLLVGILIAYTLYPVVNALQRLRLPRILATTVALTSVLVALVFGAYSLRTQFQTIVNQLPAASSKLSSTLAGLIRSQRLTVQQVESAARTLENAAKPAPAAPPRTPAAPTLPGDSSPGATAAVPEEPVKIVVAQPAFDLNKYLWAGSVGAVGFIGQAVLVFFLVFFLLLTGDTFKRKIAHIAGPSLSKKRITVAILDDINQSIQRYMLMLLVTNIMVGLLSWIAFRLIGLENAGAWAVAAGVLHVVPYFGAAVAAGVTGAVAFIQFDSLYMALLVAGASLLIATFVGNFVTTWMTGRIARMNTAAVFVALLFMGWLWGVWGVLLSIPVIVIIKVVSQRIEELHPLAELLGE